MTASATSSESSALQAAEQADNCSSEGCSRAAKWSIRFHGQPGHVHDCDPHTALLREHCDVAEVLPVNGCPWPHGLEWADQPAALGD